MGVRKTDTEVATIKKIVFAVLPEAIRRASGDGKYPFSARGLYYQVRPLIQAYTKKELSYDYFTPPLLTEYQQIHGTIPELYYEARGVLIEPHTGKEVPLGTREVAAYRPEPWTFNKILYVEKTGLLPILRAGRLAEKYDMALMSGQGFASRSAKELLADFEREFQDVTILCLHDCDISGHEIVRTLAEGTRTSKHKIKVHNLGLNAADVKEYDLETEVVYIKQTPPEEFLNRLSRVERRFFLGRMSAMKNGIIKGNRCELNAFRPDELLDYVEKKLSALGLASKILPPEEVLIKERRKSYKEQLRENIRQEVYRRLDTEGIIKKITDQLLEREEEDSGKYVLGYSGDENWRALVNSHASEEAQNIVKNNPEVFNKYL